MEGSHSKAGLAIFMTIWQIRRRFAFTATLGMTWHAFGMTWHAIGRT